MFGFGHCRVILALIIENEKDYEVAMYIVDKYFNVSQSCIEGRLLDVMVDAVVAYEEIHYPIGELNGTTI